MEIAVESIRGSFVIAVFPAAQMALALFAQLATVGAVALAAVAVTANATTTKAVHRKTLIGEQAVT
jgi:hypothetical protein